MSKRLDITKLEVKWTVSRGQDTYGYNICSLWSHGCKVATCMGGGYDMLGTSLGNYLESAYQKELQAAFIARQADATTYARQSLQLPSYYGMHMAPDGKVHLDGGCGFSAMEKIATELLGLEYDRSINKRGHITAIYLCKVLEG